MNTSHGKTHGNDNAELLDSIADEIHKRQMIELRDTLMRKLILMIAEYPDDIVHNRATHKTIFELSKALPGAGQVARNLSGENPEEDLFQRGIANMRTFNN